MEYRRLGRSGLRVSRIGLGCMSYGQAATGLHQWTLDEDAAAPFFQQAVVSPVRRSSRQRIPLARSDRCLFDWPKSAMRWTEAVTVVHTGWAIDMACRSEDLDDSGYLWFRCGGEPRCSLVRSSSSRH